MALLTTGDYVPYVGNAVGTANAVLDECVALANAPYYWPPKSVAKTKPMPSVQWTETISMMNTQSWQESAFQRIKALSGLKPNWDGYGSPPVSEEVREVAATLIASLETLSLPSPSVAPGPGGGMQIEWETKGRAIELHISPSLDVEYLLVLPGLEETKPLNKSDPAMLNSLFQRLL